VIGGPNCTGVASVADHRCGRGSGGNKGLNTFVALVAACGACNNDKESLPRLATDCRERGITVPYSGNHGSLDKRAVTKETLHRLAQTPVTDADGQSWWLLPSGVIVPHEPGVPF